jgi:CubicO group peptidase (beta-lactamase class C family)
MSDSSWWDHVIEGVDDYHRTRPENLPGAVFAAETEADGRLIGAVGDGWAADTICEIGSMTKAFTATAVLLALEEHGRLDPELAVWRLPGMEAYADDPTKRRVRVRHLLQHTTGLPNVQPYKASPPSPCNDPTGGPPTCVDGELDLGPTVPWTCFPGGTNECIHVDGRCRPARTLSLEQVSRHVMQVYSPPTEPPVGTQYCYSPLNYVIAARIVETLSGESLNRYLKRKLFVPVDMVDSFFIAQQTGEPKVDERLDEGVVDEQRRRIADVTLITRDGRMPPEVAPGPDGHWDKFRKGWRFVYPDGGMYTTVNDLLNFLGMIRDGGLYRSRRILSPEVVRLLGEDHGFGHTMGFGYRSQPNAYGQGPGTLEHLGGKMTYFWYDPHAGSPIIGAFLSQRLPNIAVNNNMTVGMQVIFRVFLTLVNRGVFESFTASPPAT